MAKRKPKKKLRESEDEVKQKKQSEAEDETETENEDESESEEESEDESETESEDEDEGGADDHDDKNQDVALIKKMIADSLGDGAKSLSKKQTEAMIKFGKQAYQAYQDMGESEDEAYKCAGKAMKLAHHMSSKQEEDETESEDEDVVPPKKKGKGKPAPKDDGDGDDDDDGASSSESEDESETESEGKKESKVVNKLRKELLEAEGRIAALEAKDRKVELNRYIEAAFKKSGQPVSVTKRFREAAGKLKSKFEFDAKWKIFLEGAKDRPNRSDEDFSDSLFSERATTTEDGERTSGDEADGSDFSDCAD